MFKKQESMSFIFNDLSDVSAKFREGETVLETALRHRLPLDSSCTEGTCGACRVTVMVAPPNLDKACDVELETKAERGFSADERLACQMNACAGLKVKVPSYKRG